MTDEQHWGDLSASAAQSWESLQPLLEGVHDLQSFVRFIDGLRRDSEDADRKETLKPAGPYSSGWNGWENGSISAFLEAAVAWAEASPRSLADENPWKAAAKIIYAGKCYE